MFEIHIHIYCICETEGWHQGVGFDSKIIEIEISNSYFDDFQDKIRLRFNSDVVQILSSL